MIIVQHLLVLFLVVGMPLWDWYEIPRLKASTAPRKKVRYYQKIAAALWICIVVAALTIGVATAFFFRGAPGEIAWLEPGSRGRVILEGIAAGMLIAILLPAVLALRSEKIRAKAGRAAKKLAFLLPSSGEERRWWWLVCITAGICEEFIYRGFLLHYLHVLPFHLSLGAGGVVDDLWDWTSVSGSWKRDADGSARICARMSIPDHGKFVGADGCARRGGFASSGIASGGIRGDLVGG